MRKTSGNTPIVICSLWIFEKRIRKRWFVRTHTRTKTRPRSKWARRKNSALHSAPHTILHHKIYDKILKYIFDEWWRRNVVSLWMLQLTEWRILNWHQRQPRKTREPGKRHFVQRYTDTHLIYLNVVYVHRDTLLHLNEHNNLDRSSHENSANFRISKIGMKLSQQIPILIKKYTPCQPISLSHRCNEVRLAWREKNGPMLYHSISSLDQINYLLIAIRCQFKR